MRDLPDGVHHARTELPEGQDGELGVGTTGNGLVLLTIYMGKDEAIGIPLEPEDAWGIAQALVIKGDQAKEESRQQQQGEEQ